MIEDQKLFVADNFEHIYVMAHGKILLEGNASEVFSKEDVLKEARLQKPYMMQLYDEIKNYV